MRATMHSVTDGQTDVQNHSVVTITDHTAYDRP